MVRGMVDSQKRGVDAGIEALYGEDITFDYESELHELVQNLWGAPREIDWAQEADLSDSQ